MQPHKDIFFLLKCIFSCVDHPNQIPNKSRQFDLFSLFFGDEFDNVTLPEAEKQNITSADLTHSAPLAQSSNSSASDSIFDAIRAGLKYIERNDDTLETILDNTVKNSTTTTTTTALPVSQKESELSFLDILLGDDDDDEDEEELNKAQSVWSPTTSTTEKLKEDFLSTIANVRRNEHPIDLRQRYNNSEIGHVSDMRERIAHTTQIVPTSTKFSEPTSYENTYPASTEHFETDTPTSISDVWDTSDTTVWDTSTFDSTIYDTSTLSTLDWSTNFENISTVTDNSIENVSTEQTKHLTANPEESTPIVTKEDTTVTVKEPTIAHTKKKPTKPLLSETSTNSYINDLNELLRHNLPVNDIKISSGVKIHETVVAVRPKLNITTTTENIFSAFLDGISEIFGEKNESFNKPDKNNKNNTNILNSTVKPTLSKINTMKRLTVPPKLNDTTTTVSITSTTVSKTTPMPPTAAPRPPSAAPSSSPLTPQAPLNKPLLFNSNPSILEADLNYDYGEPTLPPSLPNLKIIPFLPADAVQNNRNTEFNKPTGAYPISTENFKNAYNQKPLEVVALTLGENEYSKESKTGQFELFGVDDKVPSDAYSRNNEPPEFSSYSSDTTGFPHDQLFHLPSGVNLEHDGYDHTSYPSITESYNQVVDSSYANFGGSPDYHYNTYKIPLDKHIVLPEKFGSALKYTGQPQQQHYDETGTIENSYGIVPSFEKFATIYPENKSYSKISTINPVFDRNNQFSPPSKTEGNFKDNCFKSRMYLNYY